MTRSSARASPIEAPEQGLTDLGSAPLGNQGAPAELLDVGARAECAGAGARDEQRPGVRAFGAGQHVAELFEYREIQRVQRLRPVERHDCELVPAGQCHRHVVLSPWPLSRNALGRRGKTRAGGVPREGTRRNGICFRCLQPDGARHVDGSQAAGASRCVFDAHTLLLLPDDLC
jgi:hypothetical protein